MIQREYIRRIMLALVIVVYATEVSTAQYFPPRGEWATKSPSETGMDAALLDSAVAFALANEYSGPRDLRRAILKGFEREPYHEILGPTKKRGGPAGLVIKDGYIIASWGDVERVDMTFSVTKSYLSTIAGLAVDEGLIHSLDDPVAPYVWDGTFAGQHNSKITWRDLLEQSSDWTGELFGVKDWADRPPRDGGVDDWKLRELNEPGTVFEYNDVRVNVLAYALLQVWRKPLPQVLKEALMDPIGASSTWRWFGYDHSWTTVDGQKMQSVSGGGHSGGGVFINTLDHARFGLLFAREGNWDNEHLISESWVKEVQKPSSANAAYGLMWWLNNEPRALANVAKPIYYAAGFGGNFIVIDQEEDLIFVTRWLEPSQMAEMTKRIQAALTP
ncbi:MAG: beta-lactamase family protein [Saprospiraceae bacterium]|nr:beta-lactamase family protein [Saprospiraceae bacterium]